MTFPPIESSPLSFPSVRKIPNLDEQKIWLSHQNIYAERIVANWKDWTPTYTNLSVGDGTVVARYVQIGKIVIVHYNLLFGSTTSISGSVELTTPVGAGSTYVSFEDAVGVANYRDAGSNRFAGTVTMRDAAKFQLWVHGAASTHVNFTGLSSSVPMTWTTSDILTFSATYEAA